MAKKLGAKELLEKLDEWAGRENADIFVFASGVAFDMVERLRSIIFKMESRKANAILIVSTFGGEADPAFRLIRSLRTRYNKITVGVFGMCKSAGTLLALGADHIVMGDLGELGPLDVQMTKPDELMSATSGLDILQAVGVIENSAFGAFENAFLKIISNSGGNISAKTSAEIAREFAVGLFSPMTSQIDPERLGEVQRAVNIARAYGERLDKGNLKAGGLDKLVQEYPTHGFVIDLEEAQTIFSNVRAADSLEASIAFSLPGLRSQPSQPFIGNLIEMLKPTVPAGTGASNVQEPKDRRTGGKARRRPGAGDNVAQLRPEAADHPKTSEANGDAPKLSAASKSSA
jgi:hypothetical protein